MEGWKAKTMEDEGIKKQSNNLAPIKLKDKDFEYGSMVRDVIGQLNSISYELDNEAVSYTHLTLPTILLV